MKKKKFFTEIIIIAILPKEIHSTQKLIRHFYNMAADDISTENERLKKRITELEERLGVQLIHKAQVKMERKRREGWREIK